MKIACIGDVHIKTDNIPDINIFQERLTQLLLKEKPNYIVILGDVLHTHEHLHTLPLNKAYEFITSMRTIAFTYVLVGNHDMINNSQFLSDNHWMNSLKEVDNIEIVDKVSYNENGFMLCPYVPNGRFIEALETHERDFKKMKVIFAHQEFKGCKMGAIISETGDEWNEKYPLVVSGHIHAFQKINNNIYYTGSSLMNAFGESEKNYVCFYEDGKMREYDLELPRKKIIYSDITDIDDVKFDEENSDRIKISISGNFSEFKAFKKTEKYKEISKKGVKIVFKPKRIEKEEKRQEVINLKNEDKSDFLTILRKLIENENSMILKNMFEEII